MQTNTPTTDLIKELLELTATSRKVSGFGFPTDSHDDIKVKRLVNKIADIKGVDLSSDFFEELSLAESTPLIQRLTLQRLQNVFEFDI